MAEYWVINGHLETCAYIRSLHPWDGDDPEECDCEHEDDDGDNRDLYDEDLSLYGGGSDAS